MGTASEGLGSFLKDSVLIPRAEITAELEGERWNGPSAYTKHSCAQLKAATHIGNRREHNKSMGSVAASWLLLLQASGCLYLLLYCGIYFICRRWMRPAVVACTCCFACNCSFLLVLCFDCHLRHTKTMIASSMPTEECIGHLCLAKAAFTEK